MNAALLLMLMAVWCYAAQNYTTSQTYFGFGRPAVWHCELRRDECEMLTKQTTYHSTANFMVPTYIYYTSIDGHPFFFDDVSSRRPFLVYMFVVRFSCVIHYNDACFGVVFALNLGRRRLLRHRCHANNNCFCCEHYQRIYKFVHIVLCGYTLFKIGFVELDLQHGLEDEWKKNVWYTHIYMYTD